MFTLHLKRSLCRVTVVTIVDRTEATPLGWWPSILPACQNHLGSIKIYLPDTGICFSSSPGGSNTQLASDHCQRLTASVLENSNILAHFNSQRSGSQGSLWQDKLRKCQPFSPSVCMLALWTEGQAFASPLCLPGVQSERLSLTEMQFGIRVL